ncbi:MAG: hypothetical protein RL697_479 [Pseudomonadota bacterium]
MTTVNAPSPAIVAQHAVRRLPRAALWLLSLAYVLSGFVGRTAWKNDDLEAFGFIWQLATPLAGENASWLHPTLLGQADANLALLPYWLGALAIKALPWLSPELASRIPFAGLLLLTLICTWYAIYALARHPQAQPVAFAFGGEARPADYARALADGGLLALIACLGLARLGHEGTAALSQLACASLVFFALSNHTRHRLPALLAMAAGMLGLTLSGGPTMSLLLGLGGTAVLAAGTRARALDLGLMLLITLMCVTLAGSLDLWRLRLQADRGAELVSWAKLLLWFTWPTWPLVLWSLWRWRHALHQPWRSPHLALPLWFALVTIGSTWLTGLSDRALLLSLPALAALAAFALPTLNRGVSAFIDWFTLLFFTVCVLTIWVVWVAMQTGFPQQPAANVARLAPGFEPSFSFTAFTLAVIATLCWVALVRWRVGRHRAALWKSMALPAGGAALCWLLLMTLWLPLLDYARSYAPLSRKLVALVEPSHCVAYIGLTRAQVTGLRLHAGYDLTAYQDGQSQCSWLFMNSRVQSLAETDELLKQWELISSVQRPTDGNEWIAVFRRRTP